LIQYSKSFFTSSVVKAGTKVDKIKVNVLLIINSNELLAERQSTIPALNFVPDVSF